MTEVDGGRVGVDLTVRMLKCALWTAGALAFGLFAAVLVRSSVALPGEPLRSGVVLDTVSLSSSYRGAGRVATIQYVRADGTTEVVRGTYAFAGPARQDRVTLVGDDGSVRPVHRWHLLPAALFFGPIAAAFCVQLIVDLRAIARVRRRSVGHEPVAFDP